VVTGTFSAQAQLIDTLFDSSPVHSFISVELVEKLWLVPTHRPPLLSLTLPDGKIMKCDELYEDFPITMYEHEFQADQYKFE